MVSEEILTREVNKLTDWFTDDLFCSPDDVIVKAEFSRIFCDAERFADDEAEVMAKYGMGVLYEKSDKGEVIRKVSPELRERILRDYYWVHHKRLSLAVAAMRDEYGCAIILDCHSFPDKPFLRDLNQEVPRPDFNIGTDVYHTPHYLIEISREFFNSKGYSLGIDFPYCGSLVPLEYYRKDKRVKSIMLEVNRKLYLDETTNCKSPGYLRIKAVISEFISIIGDEVGRAQLKEL